MELLISFLSDWGYIALFICMALENMNIPIPSEIILGFAGFLVSQQIFSFGPPLSSVQPPVSQALFYLTTWGSKADGNSCSVTQLKAVLVRRN